MAKKSKKAKYKVTTISHKDVKKDNTSMGLAVISLILNFLVIPGLGSLIGGKTKAGVWQIILFFIGAIGTYTYYLPQFYYYYAAFGVLMLISWIWGIVTGTRMIQSARIY